MSGHVIRALADISAKHEPFFGIDIFLWDFYLCTYFIDTTTMYYALAPPHRWWGKLGSFRFLVLSIDLSYWTDKCCMLSYHNFKTFLISKCIWTDIRVRRLKQERALEQKRELYETDILAKVTPRKTDRQSYLYVEKIFAPTKS